VWKDPDEIHEKGGWKNEDDEKKEGATEKTFYQLPIGNAENG
jgi:hypothetical protein